MALLARREHSEQELRRKLSAREFDQDLIEPLLQELKQEGLQSDHRFTEAFVHQRIEKGYGPLRISRELQERGIADGLADEILVACAVDWQASARRVREKKFGSTIPAQFSEKARQLRFLQYRGFSTDQLRHLFDLD